MVVLGISCHYHDSAACLIRDGAIVAAAQEERFSRVRNTAEFPIQAINFCVQQAGVPFDEIDHVAYFEKPFLKFSRVVIDHLEAFPFSFKAFLRTMPKWLDDRLSLPLTVQEEIGYEKQIHFLKHHLSHAASAFLPSPFEEAAIMTADGVGEWATFSVGRGAGTRIEVAREIHYPHSLGLLYTTFTTHLGFEANGGEGKTMGLAGYGQPSFLSRLRECVSVREDGSFRMDDGIFAFRRGSRMWSRKFLERFGPPRTPGSPLEQRHYDLAASVQKLVEEVMILNARRLQKSTGLKRLCIAGGVGLNCVTNHKILERTDFTDIFVQPASGDAGGALGSALYVYHCLKENPRVASMQDAYLGPSYSDREILAALTRAGVAHRRLEAPELVDETARILAENKTLGWFQGRMEFGPRALGNRSILGNPCFSGMKERLNDRIKKREAFRPFAPVVLAERAAEFFEIRNPSPYMLLAPKIRPEKASLLPAITHVDGTARVQTVDERSNPLLRRLLTSFEKRAGVPILINTSFNRKGEPVVCRPEHAVDCFVHTRMDALAIGNYLVERGD